MELQEIAYLTQHFQQLFDYGDYYGGWTISQIEIKLINMVYFGSNIKRLDHK